MDTVTNIGDLRARLDVWRRRGERIVLVPTMGNLHEGHASLVAQGHHVAERIVVSVFVNPTQFGPGEDYAQYPRTPRQDAELLDSLQTDLVFTPDVADMYPHGLENTVRIDVPDLSGILC